MAVGIIALTGRHLLHPALEVGKLSFGFLRKEIVADPQRKFVVDVQFLDDCIIVGIILETTARVDHSGDAQAT